MLRANSDQGRTTVHVAGWREIASGSVRCALGASRGKPPHASPNDRRSQPCGFGAPCQGLASAVMVACMPKVGVEPTRPLGRAILSRVRLPFRHFGASDMVQPVAWRLSLTGKGGARTSVLDHRFGCGPSFTVGVEEEYMLLAGDGFELVSGVEQLLDEAAAADLAEQLKPELMQCVLESGTVVCETVADGGRRPAPPARAGSPSGRVRTACVWARRPLIPSRCTSTRRSPPATATGSWSRCCSTSPAVSSSSACTCTSPCPQPRGLPGGDGGRADRAAGAARAVDQLAVLAGRAQRAALDPLGGVCRLPAQWPAASLRELPGLRRRRGVHGGDRRDRRLHPPVVGRAAASRASARSRSG